MSDDEILSEEEVRKTLKKKKRNIVSDSNKISHFYDVLVLVYGLVTP